MNSTEQSDRLPAYAGQLAAFHRAFRRELRRAVTAVPLPIGGRVLDVACGDGFYSACFARRLHPYGSVVAADLSPAFLALARRTVERNGPAAAVEYAVADAFRLPFEADSFDAVWCAHSFITFADKPTGVLAEMQRVAKPGGAVAVLENDESHDILLNWPVELEVAVRRAMVAARGSEAGKFDPARRLGRLLRTSGMEDVRKRTFTADRQAPFDRPTVGFLRRHLADVRKQIAPHLTAKQLAAFDRYADPAEPTSLFQRSDAELVCVNTLFVGRKP